MGGSVAGQMAAVEPAAPAARSEAEYVEGAVLRCGRGGIEYRAEGQLQHSFGSVCCGRSPPARAACASASARAVTLPKAMADAGEEGVITANPVFRMDVCCEHHLWSGNKCG